jgi:hypothetical protein
MKAMSQTLEWAQPVDGAFEQAGAWLSNGTSSTATPTALTAVVFDTGATSTSYTVGGSGTAASMTLADNVVLEGFSASGTTSATIGLSGSFATTAGTQTIADSITDANVFLNGSTVYLANDPFDAQGEFTTTSSSTWSTTGSLVLGNLKAAVLAVSGLYKASDPEPISIIDAMGVVEGGSSVDISAGYSEGNITHVERFPITWTSTSSLLIGGSGGGTVLTSGSDLVVGAGGLTLAAGGMLMAQDAPALPAASNVLSGGTLAIIVDDGASDSQRATRAMTGTLTLAAGTTSSIVGTHYSNYTSVPSSDLVGFAGPISGTGTLIVRNAALLDTANNFTGPLELDGGTLELAGPGASGTGTVTFVPYTNGTLTYDASAAGTGTVLVGDSAATVSAGGAALLVSVGLGTVYFTAGTAASTVQGGHGRITVTGGTGGGAFFGGGVGGNIITAGDGASTLAGAGPGDVLTAGATGGDMLVAGPGAETLDGGAASDADALFGGSGPDAITTGAGADTVTAGTGADTVLAHGPTLAFGSAAALTFANGAGASSVVAGSGQSTVYGGTGRIAFYGARGGGAVFGGSAGFNFLYTGAQATTLAGGGSGDVLVSTGTGGNTLLAGPGNQTLTGAASSGNDAYFGNSGNVLIAAGTGSDTVVAGSGAQAIYGGASGATAVFAGSGQDTVVLGGAAAFVLCGQGHATVDGGSGPDIYGFANGAGGTEVIDNFRTGTDVLQLLGYTAGTAATAVAGQVDAGGNTTVTLTDNTRITLLGVASIGGASFV